MAILQSSAFRSQTEAILCVFMEEIYRLIEDTEDPSAKTSRKDNLGPFVKLLIKEAARKLCSLFIVCCEKGKDKILIADKFQDINIEVVQASYSSTEFKTNWEGIPDPKNTGKEVKTEEASAAENNVCCFGGFSESLSEITAKSRDGVKSIQRGSQTKDGGSLPTGTGEADPEWTPVDEPTDRRCVGTEEEPLQVREEPLTSSRCGQSLTSRATLDQHRPAHPESSPVSCSVRAKTLRDERLPETHQVRQIHANVEPFTCETCGPGLTTRTNLLVHKRVPTGEKPFCCPVCNKTFSRASYLRVHKRTHSSDKPFSCNQCSKGFATKRALKRHQVVHTGVKAFACEVCSRRFGHYVNLKRHRLIHTGTRPYLCTVCGKSFNQSSILKGHMQVHTVTNPFMCDICGKSFVYNCALRKHQTCHLEDRECNDRQKQRQRRRCKTCSKELSSAAALKTHQLVHTGLRPFKCDTCGKAFTQKFSLVIHQKVHSKERSHVCSVCGMGFSLSSRLKLHERTHTGERPFSCETCGMSFSISGNLMRHMRVHTGERPFSCNVCGKQFSQAGNLKTHMQVHLVEKP